MNNDVVIYQSSDGLVKVEAIVDAQTLLEVDCNFGNCIYEGSCPIGEKLRELTQTA
jgi:hypothetical protein